MPCTSERHVLRPSCSFGPLPPYQRLLRPLLTSRSGSAPSPFQAQGEISPGKNALLHRTTAAFTPPRLDHESFAVSCPLALLGSAFYAVLVHRLAIYAPRFLPTLGRPHAVALHFICRDQLMAGLAPAGVRPCWAHQKKKAPDRVLFLFVRVKPAVVTRPVPNARRAIASRCRRSRRPAARPSVPRSSRRAAARRRASHARAWRRLRLP